MKTGSQSKQIWSQRKKEVLIIVGILLLVACLTFTEIKLIPFNTAVPFPSAVLMFILININLLLLLTLLILVFRNLAKLYYEKKQNIFGSKLKARLVGSFIFLALLPTTVLFLFSIQFLSTSIAFWFNFPVEKTLNASVSVGQSLYDHISEINAFFAQRGAYQIDSRQLLEKGEEKNLVRYTQVLQRAFNCHAVEVYSTAANRMSMSLNNKIPTIFFSSLTTAELNQISPDTETNTVYETFQNGEFLRTIATIPFGVSIKEAKGFIVVSSLISLSLSKNLDSILKGIQEYQQLKLTKRPAQISYYIALSIVALLAIFCAIWFGFQLAKSITGPIMEFAEGTKRIAAGDLDYQISMKKDDEIGTLISSFNSMARQLASGRKQINLSAKMLKQQYSELEQSRHYMEIVLKNVSTGVISIDNKGLISTINKAAESMLHIKAEEMVGKNLIKMIPDKYIQVANTIFQQTAQGNNSINLPVSISISGTPKHFSLNYTFLEDEAGKEMGYIMVFDDVTELEKAQRMTAWREVARRIAHEVKNPLTPIKLSAQRLKRRYSNQIDDQVFVTCADTIVEHVDLIRNLVNQFSAFAKFPDINFESNHIGSLIMETVALYKEGLEQVEIQTNITPGIPEMKLDRQHMKQAFINLMDNAVYAVNKKGKILIDLLYDPILKIVRIEFADNGEGISDKEKTKLFEPYFSTKKTGMGLGLAIVNSIISNHNGVIRVQDNQPRGAKFIIELPVS